MNILTPANSTSIISICLTSECSLDFILASLAVNTHFDQQEEGMIDVGVDSQAGKNEIETTLTREANGDYRCTVCWSENVHGFFTISVKLNDYHIVGSPLTCNTVQLLTYRFGSKEGVPVWLPL